MFPDADISRASSILATAKLRDAGQICAAPTRLLVHEAVFDDFLDGLVAGLKTARVGHGLDSDVTMGPLANPRRLEAMERLVEDAVARQPGWPVPDTNRWPVRVAIERS